jgi:hypothetical protein
MGNPSNWCPCARSRHGSSSRLRHCRSLLTPTQVEHGYYFHRTGDFVLCGNKFALLALRFAGDAESDSIIAPYNVGLRSRICARFLKQFFEDSMTWHIEYCDGGWLGGSWGQFYVCTNFVAHLANLGCVDESAIRDHILQSLTSHPKLYYHQADGLIILFKLAGATFEKYADPSVVDRCFELLESQYGNNAVKGLLIQVRVVSCNEGLRSS